MDPKCRDQRQRIINIRADMLGGAVWRNRVRVFSGGPETLRAEQRDAGDSEHFDDFTHDKTRPVIQYILERLADVVSDILFMTPDNHVNFGLILMYSF